MFKYKLFVVLALCFVPSQCEELSSNKKGRKFPKGFLLGTATAAYQVEGAWNIDGKSESIWDHVTHKRPCKVRNCTTGDVANDSYHLYKRDVEMVRELGLDFYRFSLAWTRILPSSFPDVINKAGVDYYNNLINELLKYNIKPVVTIYHWDLPQKLQELGGWANPYIIDWYTDYARICFETFGDRVKTWISINEPREICYNGYAGEEFAPFLNITGYAEYMCTKNLLLANAKTWHMYNDEFRAKQNGTVGIAIGSSWYEPQSEEHKEATEDLLQFEWGQYAHAIFSKTGDFPDVMKRKIAAKSKQQGFFRSRLPELSPAEVDYIKGTSDFLGVNHYTTSFVYRNESVEGLYESPSYFDDIGIMKYLDTSFPGSVASWLRVVPWGFHRLLKRIKEDFGNPPILISENGYPTYGGLIDDGRISFFRAYLDALLDAIDEGSDIRGYTAWSLMDNFEWVEGFTERFGFYEVDHDSPNKTRTPRKSAYVYKEIARSRTLDYHFEPDMTVPLTIDPGH